MLCFAETLEPHPGGHHRTFELSCPEGRAGDATAVGPAAGRNAGAITVGVARTGNALGMTAAEVQLLPVAELQRRLREIHADFREAGADYVIDSVGELRQLLDGNGGAG